jgi:hypothetical protein
MDNWIDKYQFCMDIDIDVLINAVSRGSVVGIRTRLRPEQGSNPIRGK